MAFCIRGRVSFMTLAAELYLVGRHHIFRELLTVSKKLTNIFLAFDACGVRLGSQSLSNALIVFFFSCRVVSVRWRGAILVPLIWQRT